MASISSLGIGSGLDIRNLVDQLVTAERQPVENRLDRRETRIQAELSAFGALKSALGEFRSRADALSGADAFRSMQANSGNSSAVSVNASAGASAGRFDIRVDALAAAQSTASAAFGSPASVVGGGTLTFRFGEVSTEASGAVSSFEQNPDRAVATVEIGANASLSAVRDAVNEAGVGVRAAIINDGSGERLVFSANDTGADNGFIVEVDDLDGNDTDGSGLSQLAFNADATNLERTRAGADAELVVDGLAVTRSGNTIDDLIEGVTLDLGATTESAVAIDVSRDTAGVRERIEAFVEGFNQLRGQISDLAGYDAEAEAGGILQGNSAVRTIENSLRRLITEPLDVLDGRGVRSLADLGITTSREGTLQVDDARLTRALDERFEEVGALFGVTGLVDGDGFRFEGNRAATQPGRYDVAVSELATRASITGTGDVIASEAEPIVIAEGNSLRVRIDGIRTEPLTLTAGSYTSRDALAAEIQARINGDDALREAGIEVTVGFDGDRLTLTSARFGAESTVAVTAIDPGTGTALGLDTSLAASGSDVVGRIDGREAEGFGRFLTAQSGRAEGLKLEINGQLTGELGQVTFSRGIGERLTAALDSYLGADGILTASTNGLQSRIEEITSERERLARRIEQVEARYLAQFSAMDAIVAQLNQTSEFLGRQLAGLESLNARGTGNQGR